MRERRDARSINVLLSAVLVSFLCGLAGCEKKPATEAEEFQPEILPLPAGLSGYEAMTIPADNPMTPEKAALGRQLFFEKRLSGDGTRSCSSCHLCEKGLTDGLPKAVGAFNKPLPRNSPTLWNIGYHSEFYWDGRSGSLEKQALAAWKGANMGAGDDPSKIVGSINAVHGYRSQFEKVFGGPATPDNIAKAIAAFERTIIGGDTAWDRWRAGNESALTEEAKRGWKVFQDAKCTNCHSGALFLDKQYHNVGIGMEKPEPDSGRFKVTNKEEDTGAFKTPTLRDVAKSAPYFHDGSAATLEEAIDVMLAGGKPNKYLDKKNLSPVKLTSKQKRDLIAFLNALTENCAIKEPLFPRN